MVSTPTKRATDSVTGDWKTRAAVSSCCMRPSISTAMRSASARASPRSWVTSTVVTRSWRSTAPRSAISAVRLGVSSPANGSSSSRTSGSSTSARASATRCASPPGERPRLSRRERAHAEALEPRRHARRGGVGGDAAKAQAEPDVVARRGVRQQRLWNTVAIRRRSASASRASTGRSWNLRCRPPGAPAIPSTRSSVDLPLPLGPMIASSSPAATSSARDVQHEARRMHAAHVAQGEHRAHAGSTWIEPRWIENSQRRSRSISRIS